MIRFIEEKDRSECSAMLIEFYSTDAVSHPIPKEHIQKAIDSAIDNSPYIKIVICTDNTEYVGFCALSFTFSTEAGGLVVLFEDIYIRDKFKGKGYGTDFIKFVRKEYDGKAKRYRLEVAENNASAIRLYEKLGFETLPYKQMIVEM